jgi:hypothetical protein
VGGPDEGAAVVVGVLEGCVDEVGASVVVELVSGGMLVVVVVP